MKNVSCEYDRLNGWNSTLQAAWCVVHQTRSLDQLKKKKTVGNTNLYFYLGHRWILRASELVPWLVLPIIIQPFTLLLLNQRKKRVFLKFMRNPVCVVPFGIVLLKTIRTPCLIPESVEEQHTRFGLSLDQEWSKNNARDQQTATFVQTIHVLRAQVYCVLEPRW